MTSTKKTKNTNGHGTTAPHEPSVTTDAQPSTTTGTPAPVIPAASAAAAAGSGTLGAKILAITAVLEEIPILLGSPGSPAKPLSIEQRRGLPKMKPGADEQIPAVLALADKYKVSIAGPGTAEARADMKLVSDLQPLETGLATALALVSAVIAQARVRTWETTVAAYGTLKLRRYQKEYPALQRELDPMASFMAVKHKSAPTALRQAEAKTLSKSRATAKAKAGKGAKGGANTPAVPGAPPPPAPPAPPASPATEAGSVTAPAASGASESTPATSTNGATHA